MDLNKKVPEIRFSGFNDDWIEKQFKNLAVLRRGLTYSPNDIRKFGVKVLRSSNINEDVFVEYDDDVFVAREAVNIVLAKNNDILITAANGSSRLVGKHAIISSSCADFVHGGFMLLASSENPHFLNTLMGASWYEKFINKNIAGGNGAIGNLNKSHLEEEIVLVPKKDTEQSKIGNYFKELDELIRLQEQKHEKLLNLKKAMLDKMFPKEGVDVPEIRFKGFTDKWEKKKLGEIVVFFSGLTYSPINVCDWNGTLVLRSSNVKDGQISLKDNVYVKSCVVNSWNVEFGDIILVVRNGSRNLIGKHAIINRPMENTVIGAFMTGIRYKHYSFLNAVLDSRNFYNQIEMNLGATINQITIGALKSMVFKIPSVKEQEQIGAYFENLDKLITQSKEQINKYKNIKQALLQKMFV